MNGFDIFAIVLVLLVVFTLFAGIKTVPQGYDGPSSALENTPAHWRRA